MRCNTITSTINDVNGNLNARLNRNNFSGTQSLGAPTEVLKWQVELHELARELKAELDSKLIAVRTMTKAYDQASERLLELIHRAEHLSPRIDNAASLARRLADQGRSASDIGRELGIDITDVPKLLQIEAPDVPSSQAAKLNT